jgi:integrase
MPHESLTPTFVAKAPAPPADRVIYWDKKLSGFGLVVTAAGHRSFVLQYRNAAGKSRRMAFKEGLTLDQARKEATKLKGDVAREKDPLQERDDKAAEEAARKKAEAERKAIEANTLRVVAERFFTDTTDTGGAKLRTLKQRKAVFERDIFPTLGDRPIADIKRKEIRDLLEEIRRKVEAANDTDGGRSSHQAHGYLSALFNWYATKDDDFTSPIVKGMSSFKPSEHARNRVLTDDEIRAFWQATEGGEGRDQVYGAYARLVLLTATRCKEAAGLARTELQGDDWIIPAARYKGKADHVIPLSSKARDVLAGMPKFEGCPYVFTYDGKKPLNSFSRGQKAVKAKSGTDGWTLHDLRRTARTLMSRRGVTTDNAERALGHVMGGVRGTYDRYAYHREKAEAFEALAAQIDLIVNPPAADNVVAMRGAVS